MLTYILGAVILVSVVSLVGILTFNIKKQNIEKYLILFICFAAGALLGAAFFDLLPEAIEYDVSNGFSYVLLGILVFFIIERLIFWHHCHHHKHAHTFTYMNLFGDAIHNFIDGIIIAASFFHSVNVGLVTTLAVILHEIPQEMGDYSILLFGGFSRAKALVYNFLIALTSVAGALAAYFFFSAVKEFVPFLLFFAAGGFIYIACTDLFPEIKKEMNYQHGIKQVAAVIIGMLLIWLVSAVAPA